MSERVHRTEESRESAQLAAPISQWELIWRRFKHHKLGLIGLFIVLFMALIVALADFISPYHYNKESKNFSYVPPMLTRIHFFDQSGQWSGPFVYGLLKNQVIDFQSGRPRPGIYAYEEDPAIQCPIRFFVAGDEYGFWGLFGGGLFKTNIHLFGAREVENTRPLNQLDESPCQLFLFGTNKQGYDIFSMTMVGGQISMLIGPLVILAAFAVGILLGGISGYYGGGVDTFIQRLVEIFMSLPRLALLLALSLILSAEKVEPIVRFWGIVGIISLVSWAPLARVIRGQFLALREEEFITAARAVGAGDLRVILRHILPNTMSYLVVSATLTIPNVIILESILSFLGFGIRSPMVSWGLLVKAANSTLELEFHPWFLIPAGFIVVVVLAFNFLGDALRDAVDPFTVTAVKQEAS
jgi:peptide/nickel transport system permease protein